MINIDWRWLAAVAVAALLVGLMRLHWEISELKKQLKALQDFSSEPYPSEETEESQAIRDAKALAKKIGDVFTFDQAYKSVKKVRDMRKAKGDADGGNNKRTA